jgi:glycerophosphoryl diester phosphodiesterase
VADGIEFDVRQCLDNYVVIHSNALNKHVEGANRGGSDLGTVFDMTLEELRKFNVGQGERIPSLEEIFHFFVAANRDREKYDRKTLIMNADLKGRNLVRGVASAAIRYIEGGLLRPADFLFSSYHHRSLAELKTTYPYLTTMAALDTRLLFGANNVVMPGYRVQPGLSYAPRVMQYLDKLARGIGVSAIDAVIWDVDQPLVDFAAERGMRLGITAVNMRAFETEHIEVVLAAAQKVPILFKTDVPALARHEIMRAQARRKSPDGFRSSSRSFLSRLQKVTLGPTR